MRIRTFDDLSGYLIAAVLLVFALMTFLPFYYVFLASFSDPQQVKEGQLILWPKGFDFRAYEVILSNERFIQSFINTIVRTVLGLLIGMSLQLTIAYSLSKRYLPGNKWFMIFIIITMLFNGGIIPTYLIVKGTGLLNSVWALVIPSAVSTWNVILLRSFFFNVSSSMEESAKMDGANDWTIFTRIYLPLSTASLATIGLFVAVMHWNTYMDAVIYINSANKQVLQIFLRDMVVQMEMLAVLGDMSVINETSSLSVRTASIFLVSLPVIIVYPFVQKYFVKGMMLGAVKG